MASATTYNRNGTAGANGVAAFNPWDMGVGGDYIPCPPGNHAGTIVGVFYVGTQEGTDPTTGKPHDVRQMVLVIELRKKRDDGKPFVLVEKYTWSMAKKANFYKVACGVTGRQFAEGARFDPRDLLGLACLVQVSHKPATQQGEDRTFQVIDGIAQLPEGMAAPKPTRELIAWSPTDRVPLPDLTGIPPVYGDTIRELVEQSREYAAGKVEPLDAADDSADDDNETVLRTAAESRGMAKLLPPSRKSAAQLYEEFDHGDGGDEDEDEDVEPLVQPEPTPAKRRPAAKAAPKPKAAPKVEAEDDEEDDTPAAKPSARPSARRPARPAATKSKPAPPPVDEDDEDDDEPAPPPAGGRVRRV